MALNKALIAELKHEATNTRKMLERVPEDKFSWKPHEKSMTLQRIATHLAEIPTWVTNAVKNDELDFATWVRKPSAISNTKELVEHFDKTIAEAVETLENASDEVLHEKWTLRRGDHVIFEMPKVVAVRNLALNHSLHHRGQLSVYLRLLDIPVPGMYGPSADEQ